MRPLPLLAFALALLHAHAGARVARAQSREGSAFRSTSPSPARFTARSTAQAARPIDLLVRHAHVVDVETGRIARDQAIAIRGDTIVSIVADRAATSLKSTRTLDAGGRYVIPALWDMHVHFGGGDSLIAENRLLLPLYLANGVVAVRDAAGDLSPSVLAWRDSVARGQLDGPTIFTSGPKLEGKNSIWPGDLEVGSREEMDVAIAQLVAMRVDFVKLTDNTLSPDLFRYALGELRRRGLRTSAHIPVAVPVREAVDSGLSSIEHLSYAIRAGTERGEVKPGSDVMTAFDLATAQATYRRMAERGTAITPTLNISRVLAWLDSEDHSRDDYLRYIGPGLRATYTWRVERAATADAAAIARRHALYDFTSAKLPLLQRAGVLILAGTDAGFLNSFDYPGLGLHHELALMVKAGLTPLEALRAATINGARFLGRDDRHGSLRVGRAADLLLLDRNPLDDITATRSIHAVVMRGTVRDRAALDMLLSHVAREVQQLNAAARR